MFVYVLVFKNVHVTCVCTYTQNTCTSVPIEVQMYLNGYICTQWVHTLYRYIMYPWNTYVPIEVHMFSMKYMTHCVPMYLQCNQSIYVPTCIEVHMHLYMGHVLYGYVYTLQVHMYICSLLVQYMYSMQGSVCVCVSVALTAFVLCHFFVFICGIFLFCFFLVCVPFCHF